MSPKSSSKARASGDAWPDGLSADHERRSQGWRRHGRLIGLGVFSLAMVFALTGLAGVEETITDESDAATVTWHAPARLRSGEFLEMRLTVDAHQAIGELVVGVEASLWEDFTINTFFPAAAEEASEGGELLFSFGPLEAGATFLMKVDAQINPDMLWRNDGAVTVYDGDEPIAEVPVVIEVLP